MKSWYPLADEPRDLRGWLAWLAGGSYLRSWLGKRADEVASLVESQLAIDNCLYGHLAS